MRRVGTVLVMCGLAVLCGIAAAQAPDLERMDVVLKSVPDGPVAKVNGVVIGRKEFISIYQNELTAVAVRLRTAKIPDPVRIQAGVRAVGMLIQRHVLLEQAAKRKLKVSDDELNKQWNEEVDRVKKQVARGKDQEPSESDILAKVGSTREAAIAELRKALLVEKMRDQIAKEKDLSVSDEEIAKFYEANKEAFKQPEGLHLQQVFINAREGKTPADEKKRADARLRAEKALQRIQAGESFEAVAKSASEAPDKDKGGDMGALPLGALPPFFVEPAAQMKPGDVSSVIESPLGYHVFKLVERMEGQDVPLEKVTPAIRNEILAGKTQKAVDEFCKPIVQQPGYVEIYLQFEKTIASDPAFKDFREQASKEEAKPATAPAKQSKPKHAATKSTATKSGKTSKKSGSK